jgi:putative ABC transport system permease protein
METLIQDLRYGYGMLVKSPAFAVVAILTLALGIGANTAIFTVIYGVLIRPLPFPQPDRLQALWTLFASGDREGASLPDFVDWRQQAQSFDAMAAFTASSGVLGGVDEPERLIVGRATGDFSKIIQIAPVIGRFFNEAEDKPGAAKVAMLSYGLWQRRFGGRSDILGQTIQISSVPYTVIGVAPAELDVVRKVDLWSPLAMPVDPNTRRSDFLHVIGRLKPGVSPDQAQAEMSAIGERLKQEYPVSNKKVSVQTVPLHQDMVHNVRPILVSLWAAVGFVLLIVVANLSNLLLARNAVRHKEMAMRVALGCKSGRMVRQLLTESVLLAVIGGGVGIGLAIGGLDALLKAVPKTISLGPPVKVQAPVLLFSMAVAIAAGLLFGLLPSLSAARANLSDALKEGGRSAGAERHGVRRALVISEIALSLLLLVGAGLMIRTVSRLERVDLGFRADDLLTFRVMLPPALYKEPQAIAFFGQLVSRLRTLPQVKSAAAVTDLYLGGGSDYLSFVVQGLHESDALGEAIDAEPRAITPGFLSTMGIPLIRGRDFTESDNAQAAPVAIINQRLASRYFPNQDLIGKRLAFSNPGGPLQWREVIGIIGDVRQDSLASDPYPEIVLPFAQNPDTAMTVVVHTTGDSSGLLDAVRHELKAQDANAPIYALHTMSELTAASTAGPSFQMYGMGGFAGLGLLLAMVGIYGVMAQAVTQRTAEFGIRMALGARPSEILQLVLSYGLRLTAIGLALGMVGALLMARFMTSFLFGVSAHDPLTLAAVALMLALAGLVACYIPARRAMHLDPMVALRYE